MIEEIYECQKCNLYFNQKPLLDEKKKCEVFWVGLSAKKASTHRELPLSPATNTGKLIQEAESLWPEVVTYKTNLVKCLPLSAQNKLRYPNREEIDCCLENLHKEIQIMAPKIIFLLGEKVYSSIGKWLNIIFNKWKDFEYNYKIVENIYYVPIHHPSYVYIYKRKKVQDYINSIERILCQIL